MKSSKGIRKRTTARRNSAANAPEYQQLEPRQLLATYVVNTLADSASPASDGLISLREAIIAANTDAAYGDAPAGFGLDEITFDSTLLTSGGQVDLNAGTLQLNSGGIRIDGGGITINAQQRSNIFQFVDSSADLSNLVLRGGRAVDGGAIHAVDSYIGFDNVRFVDNVSYAGNGGAVFAHQSETMFSNSRFEYNFATNGGGALYMSDDTGIYANSDSVIENTVFEANRTGGSGGAIFSSGTRLKVYDSQLMNNIAGTDGGAMQLSNGVAGIGPGNMDVEITSTVFTGNRTAAGDGGAINSSGTRIGLSDSEFLLNTAGENAGALNVANGRGEFNRHAAKLNNVVFRSNRSVDGSGGGVAIANTYTTIADSTFEENAAGVDGGGIRVFRGINYSNYAELVVDSVDFNGNRALNGNGGAMYTELGLLEVTGTNFNENHARNVGGAFYGNSTRYRRFGNFLFDDTSFEQNRAVDASGGAVAINEGIAQLTDTVLTANTARAGGAVSVLSGEVFTTGTDFNENVATQNGGAVFVGDNSSFYADLSSLDSNTALGNGGAVYSTGHIGFVDSNFVDNRALNGSGGGVYSALRTISYLRKTSRVWIADSEFQGNRSEVSGGAILNDGVTELDGVEFNYNSAVNKGGAVANSGYLEVRDSKFDRNRTGRYYSDVSGVGGAIFSPGQMVVEEFSTFTGNKSGNGGAIWASGVANVRDAAFVSNTATNGGAIQSKGSLLNLADAGFKANRALGGGAINFSGDQMFGRNLTFGGPDADDGNTATSGGALRVTGDSIASISNSTFQNNSASVSGGAINLVADAGSAPTVVVRDFTIFRNNTAGNDVIPGIAIGGAIANLDGVFEARDTVFEFNSADRTGAAIHTQGNEARTTLRGVTIRDNNAGQRGGAIFNDGDLKAFDSIIVDNIADIHADGLFETFDAISELVRTEIDA